MAQKVHLLPILVHHGGSEGESGGGSSGGSGGSGSSGGSEGEGQSSSPTTKESTEKVEVTEIISKNILGEQKEPNWDLVKDRVENLYSVWSTVSIDLVQLNVPEDKVNYFNTILNELTLQVKDEKKTESIQKLVDIYGNILDFYNDFDSSLSLNEKKAKEIKYNIIIAYENVEMDKWEEAKKFVSEAQKKNSEILSNIENMNEFSIKKINIILNQLSSSLDTKDKDIFYINYRNFIQEINLL